MGNPLFVIETDHLDNGNEFIPILEPRFLLSLKDENSVENVIQAFGLHTIVGRLSNFACC